MVGDSGVGRENPGTGKVCKPGRSHAPPVLASLLPTVSPRLVFRGFQFVPRNVANQRRELARTMALSGSLPYFRRSSLTFNILLRRLAIASEYVRRPRS